MGSGPGLCLRPDSLEIRELLSSVNQDFSHPCPLTLQPWPTLLGLVVWGWGTGHSCGFAFWLGPGQKGELWRWLGANVH